MLVTYVVRLVATGVERDQVSGHVEAVETGAESAFRDANELLAFLRRTSEEWRTES